MALKREEVEELVRKRYMHTCMVCDKQFVFKHFHEKFCSEDCRQKVRSARNHGHNTGYKHRRVVSTVIWARDKQFFSVSVDYALAPINDDINDFARSEEIGIDYDIEDILETVRDNGILGGRVPYMGTKQDQFGAAATALDWAIENRSDPELVAKFKEGLTFFLKE